MKRIPAYGALDAAAHGAELVKGNNEIALATMEDKSTSSAHFVIE